MDSNSSLFIRLSLPPPIIQDYRVHNPYYTHTGSGLPHSTVSPPHDATMASPLRVYLHTRSRMSSSANASFFTMLTFAVLQIGLITIELLWSLLYLTGLVDQSPVTLFWNFNLSNSLFKNFFRRRRFLHWHLLFYHYWNRTQTHCRL